MITRYRTTGVCASFIDFEIVDGRVYNVKFHGGCPGNLQAVAKLLDGLAVSDAIQKLDGIECRNGTSCPDQLARALKEYKPK
jgi:uncharacterized protein (TIGR03905 family)